MLDRVLLISCVNSNSGLVVVIEERLTGNQGNKIFLGVSCVNRKRRYTPEMLDKQLRQKQKKNAFAFTDKECNMHL